MLKMVAWEGVSMPKRPKPPTLAKLYPDLGPEKLAIVERFYERYAEIVLRIHERLQREELEK